MPTVLDMATFTRHVRQSLQERGYNVGVTAKQQTNGQNPIIQIHFPGQDVEVHVPSSLSLGDLEDQVLTTLGIPVPLPKTALERLLSDEELF